MGLDATEVFLYTLGSALTILASSVVLFTYFRNKDLQQHPSGLIAVLALLEFIMGYHSIMFAVGSRTVADTFYLSEILSYATGGAVSSENVSEIMCGANQFIICVSIVGLILTNITLCVDLILTLWNPFVSGMKRCKYYAMIQIVVGLYMTGYICFKDGFIESCDNAVFPLEIMNLASTMILLMVYLAFAVFSCIYAAFRFSRGLYLDTEETKKYFVKHVCYVFIFNLIWVWPAISYSLKIYANTNSPTVNAISIGLVSGSGFFLGILRIMDPLVWQTLRYLKKSCKEMTCEDCWNKSPAIVILSALSNELVYWIFLSLHTLYAETRTDAKKYKRSKKRSIKNYIREKKGVGLHEYVPDLKVTEYHFDLFSEIAEASGVSVRQIADSLDPTENEASLFKESKGKSGSFFLFTQDQRFALKTVKRKEKEVLVNNLRAYADHLKKHPNSILCRIFGLFKLKAPGVSAMFIIVMENVMYDMNPQTIYDVKGSAKGRTAMNNGVAHGVLKDLDFKRNQQKLAFSTAVADNICENIFLDTRFLSSLNLIDYSLLIGISEKTPKMNRYTIRSCDKQCTYILVIIDYLTPYDYSKVIEESFSSKDASVKKPLSYANRFINFLLTVVFASSRRVSSFARTLAINHSINVGPNSVRRIIS